MPPMDDASSVAPQGDMMPPTDGQNLGSGDGFEPQGNDANIGGNMPDMGSEGGSDDTMSLFDKLSDTDKEAARSYIQSMLDKNGDGDINGDEMGAEPINQPQMPMESFIFTKGQLNKLNEEFGKPETEKYRDSGRFHLKKIFSVCIKKPTGSDRRPVGFH